MNSILVVEDTQSLREMLCAVLTCEGYQVTGVETAEEGLQKLDSEDYSIVLSDLKLPGINGIEFLQKAKQKITNLPIVVMTAYGSIDIAVEAMKRGATDFITKPFDPATLCNLLKQITEHKRIIDRSNKSQHLKPKRIITQSPKMEKMLSHLRKVAPLTSTVLIQGESGTGKELVAQAIHDLSPRNSAPFVAINCASMPSELLESEFFGHEQGSFTGATEQRIGLFEVATNGTLFLDEIGNMPQNLQMKLLRTLQESEIKPLGSNKTKKINTRVISATNCDLEEAMKQAKFREDLFYRLSVVVLDIPPLRERPEDIELLANYFVKRLSSETSNSRNSLPTLSNDIIRYLKSYSWPGNVRELENVIEQAFVFSNGELSVNSFNINTTTKTIEECSQALMDIAAQASKSAEISAITRALAETHGNKTKAAKLLGVSYKTLLNKVKDYNLDSASHCISSQ